MKSFNVIICLLIGLVGVLLYMMQDTENHSNESSVVENVDQSKKHDVAKTAEKTEVKLNKNDQNNILANKQKNVDVVEAKRENRLSKIEKLKFKGGSKRLNDLWFNVKGETPSLTKRHEALDRLGKNLNKEERYSLYEYIKLAPSDNVYDLALIDRVLKKVYERSHLSEEITSNMIEIVKDESVDGSVRGYVLQKIGFSYEDDEHLKSKKIDIFMESLDDVKTDVSGTALIQLVRLKEDLNKDEMEKTKVSATKLASDQTVLDTNKVTAIVCLGDLKLIESLPFLREQVKHSKNTVFRIAAIRALGEVGEKEDLQLLNEIINGKRTHKIVKNVLKTAVSKIKHNI